MKDKEFDNDDVINLKDNIIYKNSKVKSNQINSQSKKEILYIKPFKNERKFLEYSLILQISLNYALWLNDKYQGKIFDCPNKTKKFLITFLPILISVSFVEDFIYVLFKRDKEDKFLKKFINYEKKMYMNIKNSFSYFNQMLYKNNLVIIENHSKSDDKEKVLMKIHRDLREVERVERELRELIKNVPIQDLSHCEILIKINQNNQKKKRILNDYKEIIKSLEKMQMI